MNIENQIKQFVDGLASLREFTELIEPILLQRKESATIPTPDRVMSYLNFAVNKVGNAKPEKIEDLTKLKEAFEIISSVSNFPQKLDSQTLSIDLNVINDLERLMGASPNSIKKITNSYDQDLHIKNLYKSNLISLMSSVEWFFAQLLHDFYNEYPQSPGVNKKTLTFEDLKTFETIRDAELYLVERKIEELLRGSIDSWFDYLRDDLKIKINFIRPFINELIEISQRRNLFVHNGGMVNTIYLSKVDKSISQHVAINQPLDISKEYLENSINLIEMVFTILAAELWKKLNPEDSQRGALLISISYEYLLQKRWRDAELLSTFVMNDEFQDATSKTISQLNNWLCKKRLGNLSQDDLNKLDFSDKQLPYQLALASLKDDGETFFALLPDCLRKNEITLTELELFPIFEDMKKDARYGQFSILSN